MKTISEYSKHKRRIAKKTSAEIRSRLKPEKILLFGSVARNEAREYSDIDLIIIKNSDESFKKRMNFLYSEIERHGEIDLFWYTPEEFEKMKETSSFIRHVSEEAEVIYEKK